jgi:DNA-binding transcriptional MerR regulator
MSMLTIQEAAATTGWSARMLRYLEQSGLLDPPRSAAGYRLYGPAELQRLRTLRELLTRHDIGLTDVTFALRLRTERDLATELDHWFDVAPARPVDVPAAGWLRWEQEKHQRLLGEADHDPVKEHPVKEHPVKETA